MGLAIVFSGQGTQYPEMFNRFNTELNQEHIQNIADFLKINILPVVDLNNEKLFLNQYAQPLIAGYQWSIWNALKLSLPEPVAFAGYSLGEVTALASACDFSLKELLELTQQRAECMKTNVASGLLSASGLDVKTMTQVCQDYACFIAIRNSSHHFIVGGALDALNRCQQAMEKLPGQIHLQRLKVEVASHTPLLKAASERFATDLMQYHKRVLNYRIVSGINAHVQYQTSAACIDLGLQLQQTIDFEKVIHVLLELGADVILEIGPGMSLSHIIKQQNLPVMVKSIDDFKCLSDIALWIEEKLK